MSSIRTIFLFVLIACLAATLSLAGGQGAASNSNPEDQVTQLERDWLAADAAGDVASLRRIISYDFMGSSFEGQVLSKRDIVPERSGPGGFSGGPVGDTTVRVFVG